MFHEKLTRFIFLLLQKAEVLTQGAPMSPGAFRVWILA